MSEKYLVRAVTQRPVVRTQVTAPVVRVAAPGTGAANPSHDHLQTTPATEWIVNHNLNEPRVAVTVLSVGGAEIDAQVLNISSNQIRIYFTTATAGSALISP